jgi:hypothetical protein
MALGFQRNFLDEDYFQDPRLNVGIFALPGADTTIANESVAKTLADQASTQQQATTQAPQTVEDIYQQILGRAADVDGLGYWKGKFGETIDPTELELFKSEAAPELKAKDIYGKYVTGYDPTQEAIDLLRKQLTAPGAKEEDVLKSFLNPTDPAAAADRMFLMQADPDYVAFQKALQPAVDTSAFPKFEGRAYDPNAYNNLVNQLTAQQKLITDKTGFKYGSTFGDAQATIADMAKRLAASGISDIRDFGQRYAVVAEKAPPKVTYQDEGPATYEDTGAYRTIVGIEGYDSEGAPIYKYRDLTPSEMKRLKVDQDGMAFLDATKEDIEKNPFAESVYYNKKTGEVIDKRKIGGKAESGIWGSSGAGDGYTNYRVQFNEEGVPIFYPEKELSGMKEFVAKDLQGILSVLRFIPGAQIPVMLAQAAGAAYMGAKPGDILKNMATTAIASNLGSILSKGLPSLGIDLPTSDLGKLAFKAGTSGLASLIQGGDLETALKSAGLSLASTGITGLLPKAGEGELDYGKLLEALAPAIADGKISNADVFRLLQSVVPTDKKTPGKP